MRSCAGTIDIVNLLFTDLGINPFLNVKTPYFLIIIVCRESNQEMNGPTVCASAT